MAACKSVFQGLLLFAVLTVIGLYFWEKQCFAWTLRKILELSSPQLEPHGDLFLKDASGSMLQGKFTFEEVEAYCKPETCGVGLLIQIEKMDVVVNMRSIISDIWSKKLGFNLLAIDGLDMKTVRVGIEGLLPKQEPMEFRAETWHSDQLYWDTLARDLVLRTQVEGWVIPTSYSPMNQAAKMKFGPGKNKDTYEWIIGEHPITVERFALKGLWRTLVSGESLFKGFLRFSQGKAELIWSFYLSYGMTPRADSLKEERLEPPLTPMEMYAFEWYTARQTSLRKAIEFSGKWETSEDELFDIAKLVQALREGSKASMHKVIQDAQGWIFKETKPASVGDYPMKDKVWDDTNRPKQKEVEEPTKELNQKEGEEEHEDEGDDQQSTTKDEL